MIIPTSPRTLRTCQHLAAERVPFEVLLHPPAFTAHKRARFLHVPGRFLLKCVLVHGPFEFALAALPATQRLDLSILEDQFQSPLRLANDEEIARCFPDCERGALSPFGSLYDLTTFLEASLPPQASIIFPAQRHAVSIRMRLQDYVRLEGPERIAFGVM